MNGCHETDTELLPHHAFTLALVGNPNAGKTTLFNALTGLHAKTANFPGTTVERKVGRLHLDHKQVVVVDLPGRTAWTASRPMKSWPRMPCKGGWATRRPTRPWWWWMPRIWSAIFSWPARCWN